MAPATETGEIDMIKRVFKWFYDFEREEIWLNDMAAQGWHMQSFFLGLYEFKEGEPGEYIYRLELLPQRAAHYESHKYFRFLEETGVEIVSAWVRWVYYRRKAEEGAFDIYSDVDSRIKHYRRVYHLFIPVSVLLLSQIPLQVINFVNMSSRGYAYAWIFLLIIGLDILLGSATMKAAWKSWRQAKKLENEKKLRE